MSVDNILKNNKSIVEDNIDSKRILGFWIYLMSDCIIFSVLFAVFFVMKNTVSTKFFIKNVFNVHYVMIETVVLLVSSVLFGMISHTTSKTKIKDNLKLLNVIFILGTIFICMELYEFYNLYIHNYKPSTNGFFSAYYTLLGTHILHIVIALIWTIIIMYKNFFNSFKKNYTSYMCLGIFWHFLDIIWICIFNFVYLLGIFYE